jgi:hypothetical protein
VRSLCGCLGEGKRGQTAPGDIHRQQCSCAHTSHHYTQPDNPAIVLRRESKCAHTPSVGLFTWRASAIDKWLHSLHELPTCRSILLADRVGRHDAYGVHGL